MNIIIYTRPNLHRPFSRIDIEALAWLSIKYIYAMKYGMYFRTG